MNIHPEGALLLEPLIRDENEHGSEGVLDDPVGIFEDHKSIENSILSASHHQPTHITTRYAYFDDLDVALPDSVHKRVKIALKFTVGHFVLYTILYCIYKLQLLFTNYNLYSNNTHQHFEGRLV